MSRTITIRVDESKKNNLKNRLSILALRRNMNNGECLEWLIGIGEQKTK